VIARRDRKASLVRQIRQVLVLGGGLSAIVLSVLGLIYHPHDEITYVAVAVICAGAAVFLQALVLP
jgi:uncharacterized membrane protein